MNENKPKMWKKTKNKEEGRKHIKLFIFIAFRYMDFFLCFIKYRINIAEKSVWAARLLRKWIKVQ